MGDFWERVVRGQVSGRRGGDGLTERLRLRPAKRQHKKRHSVNRDRSIADQRKSRAAAKAAAAYSKEQRRRKQEVREYWAGYRDNYPTD